MKLQLTIITLPVTLGLIYPNLKTQYSLTILGEIIRVTSSA